MSVTCRVRIYATVDENGNLKKPENGFPEAQCRGHYDLQICQSRNIGTSSNYENFVSPIISYGHSGKAEVAFFESGRETTIYNGQDVHLYYWTFTASETAVTQLLKALGGYLEGDKPTRENTSYGKLVRYKVTKAPYNSYSASTTNCFRAVAQWCNSLGKNQLQNIYNNANSSSDYYAYKLVELLAEDYWEDKGIKHY